MKDCSFCCLFVWPKPERSTGIDLPGRRKLVCRCRCPGRSGKENGIVVLTFRQFRFVPQAPLRSNLKVQERDDFQSVKAEGMAADSPQHAGGWRLVETERPEEAPGNTLSRHRRRARTMSGQPGGVWAARVQAPRCPENFDKK